MPFNLEKESRVVVSLYNETGRKVVLVKNEKMEEGMYTFKWDRATTAAGLYLLKIEADGKEWTRKLNLVN